MGRRCGRSLSGAARALVPRAGGGVSAAKVCTVSSQPESALVAAGSSSGAFAARGSAACAEKVSSHEILPPVRGSEGFPERPMPVVLHSSDSGPHLTSAQVLSPKPWAPRCFPLAPGFRRPHPSPLSQRGAAHPEPELPVPPSILHPSPTPPPGPRSAFLPPCVPARDRGRIFSGW